MKKRSKKGTKIESRELKNDVSKMSPDGNRKSNDISQTVANWASTVLCIATILLVIYGWKQIQIERKTLKEIKTNITLTHKPVVFLKTTVPPQDKEKVKDGRAHWFVITNSGRLPAKNLKVSVGLDDVYGSKYVDVRGLQIKEFALIELASVYPNQEIYFRISDSYLPSPVQNIGAWKKALIDIDLQYEGEGLKGKFVEKQYLIFSSKTGYRWRIVGSDFLRRVKREQGR